VLATTYCHLGGSGERNQEQSRTKVSLGRTMIRAFPGTDEAMLNSEEIKPVAFAVIGLCLSEGISQIVCQIVSQSV